VDAAQSAMPSIAAATTAAVHNVSTGAGFTHGASTTVANLHQLDGRDPVSASPLFPETIPERLDDTASTCCSRPLAAMF
jgi:hypothetical protein